MGALWTSIPLFLLSRAAKFQMTSGSAASAAVFRAVTRLVELSAPPDVRLRYSPLARVYEPGGEAQTSALYAFLEGKKTPGCRVVCRPLAAAVCTLRLVTPFIIHSSVPIYSVHSVAY